MDWGKNPASFRNRASGEISCDWKSGFRHHSGMPNRCGKWPIEAIRSFRGLSFAGLYEISASGVGKLANERLEYEERDEQEIFPANVSFCHFIHHAFSLA